MLKFGDGGVLVDPDADPREWFWGTLYTDCELVISAGSEHDATREVLTRGDACAQASYRVSSGLSWGGNHKAFTKVAVAADMVAFAQLNMCYWFHTCTKVTEFSGLGNFRGVREVNFALASCSAVATLDLRGLDPSALTNLTYAFASRSALATILVYSTWALPSSGLSGSQCFYSSKLLVGGNGTAWSSSNVSYKCCVTDKDGRAGYLAALIQTLAYVFTAAIRERTGEAAINGMNRKNSDVCITP